MRGLFVVVLLFAATISTSFILFPIKPAAAQSFDFSISQDQDNNCFFGSFLVCDNSAEIAFSTSGNPPVGSATLHQTQLNECAGSEDPTNPTSCANTAGTELLLSALDQASIESNSKQLSEQTNICVAGASCENTGQPIFINTLTPEVIIIAAEDQAIVKANTEQGTFQDNMCGGSDTDCSNSGFDFVTIFASDEAIIEADSQQSLHQGSVCNNAVCNNAFGINDFEVIALDQASIDAKAAQDSEQKNECNNAACENRVGVDAFIVSAIDRGSIEATGEQDFEQGNECNNAACENSPGENFLSIGASGNSFVEFDVTQDFDQGNECQAGASDCSNFLAQNAIFSSACGSRIY